MSNYVCKEHETCPKTCEGYYYKTKEMPPINYILNNPRKWHKVVRYVSGRHLTLNNTPYLMKMNTKKDIPLSWYHKKYGTFND